MLTPPLRLTLFFVFVLSVGCGTLKRTCVDDCGKGKHHTAPTANSRKVECGDPVLEAAASLTAFEDDLRRDGTITVKTPDVWGDRNLMHWIQEFDTQLASKVKSGYQPTFQGIDAISDNAKVTIELQGGITGGSDASKLPERTAEQLSVSANAFEALKALSGILVGNSTLTLEPTEQIRQEATYVYVNQALRRKNMGGDNTRQAGYGLYLFRIPVSVLPGAETSQGFAAIVNFRARTVVTPADVKFTLPRMAVADLVDVLAPYIEKNWDKELRTNKEQRAELRKWLNQISEPTKKKLTAQIEFITVRLHKLDNPDEHSPAQTESLVLEINRKVSELRSALCQQTEKSLAKKREEIADFDSIIAQPRQNSRNLKSKYSLAIDGGSVETEKLVEITDQLSKIDVSDDVVKKNVEELVKIKNVTRQQMLQFEADLDLATKTIELSSTSTFLIAGSPVLTGPTPSVQEAAVTASGIPALAQLALNEVDYVHALRYFRDRYESSFEDHPTIHEVRHALFKELLQITNHLDALDGFEICVIENATPVCAILHAARLLEAGKPTENIGDLWREKFKTQGLDGFPSHNCNEDYLTTAWLVAQQCGLVDLNIKRILDEMQLNEQADPDEVGRSKLVNFFAKSDLPEATKYWQMIVTQEFPLQVFTLEPEVEEQNVVEAMSRIREMQLALAMSVAQGKWNTAQRVNMARRLARDAASIGLNRTVVGFVHAADTFGWYFYPRVQPPAPEGSNLGVFAKTCFTAGPTRAEDIKSRRLEPGIRECEVLIAMPSFVQQVEFEVTTNWESLACPGKPKRTYQEMLAQGAKWQRLEACLAAAECSDAYRPADLAGLTSRVAQLEHMLGIQTHLVNVPFAFEQTATDLFDTGDRNLVPVIHGYYGLKYLALDDRQKGAEAQHVTAEFFITGRNFHPTETHVIVGGHEAHEDGVEILSRELIKVRVNLKESRLSEKSLEVRVGTPNGLSNPMTIRKHVAQPVAEPETPPSDFDWNVIPEFDVCRFCKDGRLQFQIAPNTQELGLLPSAEFKFAASEIVTNPEKLQIAIRFEAVFEDNSTRDLGKTQFFEVGMATRNGTYEASDNLKREIKTILDNGMLTCCDPPTGKIIGTTYVRLDAWPWIKCQKQIVVHLNSATIPGCDCSTATKAPSIPAAPEMNNGKNSTPTPASGGSYFLPSQSGVEDVYSTIGSLDSLGSPVR